MKKILMLCIVATTIFSCNSTKSASTDLVSKGKEIENKLNGSWVLEEMNGKKITAKDFQKIPQLEISPATSSFSGFSGCNTVSGKLFSSKKGELKFLNAVSTKKACLSGNKESDFLKLLTTSMEYNVGSTKLSLSNQFGPTLVLKKVN